MRLLLIGILLMFSVPSHSAEPGDKDYPSHTITNGLITAKLYLPDNDNGFYRASRFDWSGIIHELKYKGCDYFGQWYLSHNPKVNDAVCGPADEFEEIGWSDADADDFLKIGVGGLRRHRTERYNKFKLYEITNPGKWTINRHDHKIEFIHIIEDVSGYSYRYTKCIELVDGCPKLLISHRLENAGKKLIRTKVYNHNFFTIGHLPTTADIIVRLPADIAGGVYTGNDGILHIDKDKIEFKRQLAADESVMMYDVLGDNEKTGPIIIENRKLKAGVCITSDTGYSTIHFWASERTYCPEPYINIEIFPQEEISWKLEYTFYVK